MRNTFTTFCATSLVWSLGLLYCFTSGHIERHTPDYVAQLADAAQPVHLSRR